MSGVFLGSSVRGAHRLLLHNHIRAPISGVLFQPSTPHARVCTRFPLLSCNIRKPPTRLSATASSVLSSPTVSASAAAAAAAATAAATASASPISSRIGILSWYLGMIQTRPVITKSVTAATIFAAADMFSQQMATLASPRNLDFVRILRMAGYGLLVLGPSLHLWFNFVSRILPKQDIVSTLKKMLLGQTSYGPLMTAVFFSLNAAVQGETISEIFARLKRDLIPTMARGFLYWPMCDFITFKFVPVQLQPLVCNSFSFFWTIYLTYMASTEKVNIPKDSSS
ncbi:protein SYM1 [Canna indica]|uniref:Protein SYM1 n=1 Tax=Canna indica TaxID=4628 RepID=A0AAQ3Q8J2_9LILI|nr:protein SYM1 [Canna indica]